MERIKLVKIKELEDAFVPNNKEVGYEKEGFLIDEPTLGEGFWCYYDKWGSTGFRTSIVNKIIDKDTFKTMNSIYQIIREVEEE